MRTLAISAVLLVASTTLEPVAAQRTGRCIVSDPTGTPLNVRASPQGRVVSTIRNGAQVRVTNTTRDHKGQPWAYIVGWENGREIGWVFREFVSCY